jgi:Na+-translocating ferredoxin:NAD+ oxidoreductase RnfA subunit
MLFRPLRVFLPLVILCVVYGTGKMILDITRDPNISASAIAALLSGLQILLIGMLGDAMATRIGRLNPNAVYGVQPRELPGPRDAVSTPPAVAPPE